MGNGNDSEEGSTPEQAAPGYEEEEDQEWGGFDFGRINDAYAKAGKSAVETSHVKAAQKSKLAPKSNYGGSFWGSRFGDRFRNSNSIQ